MKLLRGVLLGKAAVWAVSGVALSLFPVRIVRGLLDQPWLPEHVWVRMVGILAVGMALLMVLVARRIEDVWWWSWAFVLAGGAIASLSVLKAAFATIPGAPAWPWWLLAGVNGLFTLGLLVGLALTGTRRSPE